MTVIELLQKQVTAAHETLESTVADIKKNHLHKQPGGKALNLASAYAHLVYSEDAIIMGMLQNQAPSFTTTWKGKTGASQDLPAFDQNWTKNHTKWAKTVKVDLAQLQKYAKAVYKQTDAYLKSLSPKDLDQTLDLGEMGKPTREHIISNYVIGHANNLAGEISAVKGVFGAKGYTF